MGVAVWLQGYSRSRRILRVIFFVPVLTRWWRMQWCGVCS